MEDIYYESDDKILIFPTKRLAVISDLHISGDMSKRDVQFIENSITNTLSNYKVESIVFNGDTFTDFPFHREGKAMIERLRKEFSDVILLEGNHEHMVGGLGSLEVEQNKELVLNIGEKTVCIYHGNEEPNSDADVYIIGHIHPTINVEGDFRPCLLENVQSSYKVVIMPSYTKIRNLDYSNQTSTTPLLHNLSHCSVKHIF